MNALAKLPFGFGELLARALGVVEGMDHQLLAWTVALSPVAAAFVAALALTAAVVGARRPAVRVVAAVVGMLIGFAYAFRFEPWLRFLHVPVRLSTWTLGIAFAIFGAGLPEGITFVLGGLFCGAMVASFFPSDDRTYAFLPAFLVGGAGGVLAFPLVAALVSSFGGGLVCASALAVLLPRATLGGYFLTHPASTAGVGFAIGLAGFIGQWRPPAAAGADQARGDEHRKAKAAAAKRA